jgi:ribosome biogenesis GTPase A
MKAVPFITINAGYEEQVDDLQLEINQEAVKLLKACKLPVAVVTIVGAAKLGKSFLLSQLYGKDHVFPSSNSPSSTTKGLWMAMTETIVNEEKIALVLIDTEGIHGHLMRTILLRLSFTLSSHLIFNVGYNQNAIDYVNLA